MSRGEAAPDRSAFADLALRAFAFLLESGFGVARREPTLVRLESRDVFVNLYHGRASYAIGLELGRLDRAELYSLHEVLTAIAPETIDQARYQAVEPDVIDRCLRVIAETLRANGSGLLVGDDGAFEILRESSSKLRQTTTLAAQYGAVVDQGDRAWIDGDRRRAAELYASAEPGLDETRRRRLTYVRSKERLG